MRAVAVIAAAHCRWAPMPLCALCCLHRINLMTMFERRHSSSHTTFGNICLRLFVCLFSVFFLLRFFCAFLCVCLGRARVSCVHFMRVLFTLWSVLRGEESRSPRARAHHTHLCVHCHLYIIFRPHYTVRPQAPEYKFRNDFSATTC